MAVIQAAGLAVARLTELRPARSHRYHDGKPMEGFCLITSDSGFSRVTLHVENGQTLTDRSGHGGFYYEGWLVGPGGVVSLGAFNVGPDGRGSATRVVAASQAQPGRAELVRVTAEPFGGSRDGAIAVLEGKLIWLDTAAGVAGIASHGGAPLAPTPEPRPVAPGDPAAGAAGQQQADGAGGAGRSSEAAGDPGPHYGGSAVSSPAAPFGAATGTPAAQFRGAATGTPAAQFGVATGTPAAQFGGGAVGVLAQPAGGPATSDPDVHPRSASGEPQAESASNAGGDQARAHGNSAAVDQAGLPGSTTAVDPEGQSDSSAVADLAGQSDSTAVADPAGQSDSTAGEDLAGPSDSSAAVDAPAPSAGPVGVLPESAGRAAAGGSADLGEAVADTSAQPPAAPTQPAPRHVNPLAVQVQLEQRHPMTPRATGTATINLRRGHLTLTLRGLPSPTALGRDRKSGRPFNAYRVWLINQKNQMRTPAGYCERVWGENFRFEAEGLPLNRCDTILITAEDRSVATSVGHPAPQVLIGSYDPRL